MSGETDLRTLLARMQPELHELPYVFCSVTQDVYKRLPLDPLGVFREQEGITLIVSQQQAADNGLPFDTTWACITLKVHSSLSAVGFLAVITDRLARAGISVNVVSGYYHDHLFVPWESRWRAIDELKALSIQAALDSAVAVARADLVAGRYRECKDVEELLAELKQGQAEGRI